MSRRPVEVGSAQTLTEGVAGTPPVRVHLHPKRDLGRKARIGSKPTNQLAST